MAGSNRDRAILPTGTVSLVLGDIEGSTRLWETDPKAMGVELAGLNRLITEAVAAHHGVRPVEQGEGDSFVAAFSRCSDAVACALHLARATTRGRVHLRIGIHSGEVQLRDEGNYMGPPINRAARIRDAGNGGQILLSRTAADLVADDLPDGATLVDLGEHRLRDLERSERIWLLAHRDLPSEPRPLRTLASARTNLPAQLTSFIGRQGELAELRQLLETARAVSLIGAGGCGKTRLAVQVGADRLADYGGGVWFADLASINELQGVPLVVAAAMGVMVGAGSPVDTIARAIGAARTLLVLDNCEHLIEQCATLAEELLRRCPGLVVVATSREPLGISGEVTYRVPSLSLPDRSEPLGAEELGAYEAVQLFVDRARLARPGFTLDDSNASELGDICRRLDGIPLAIELAAARLRVLSPAQVRDGLNDRFRLLTGGSRTAVPRQQTLQASVEWSYALLLEAERALLNRLSVFAGTFDVGGAEAVCAGDPLEPHHVLELLTQLVDKSLVLPDQPDAAGGARFSLLETVRAYGAARLVENGEAEAVRASHYRWCLELASQDDRDENAYRARVTADYDNIRRALQWAEGQAEPGALARLASRMYLFWATSPNMAEGAQWFDKVVAREDEPARLANASGRLALLLSMAGDYERAMVEGHRAVEMTRALGDRARLVWTLLYLGQSFPVQHERVALIAEALETATELGDTLAQAWASYQVGFQRQDGAPDAAIAPLEDAIRLSLAHGYGWVERMARATLAIVHVRTGSLGEAAEELDAAAAALRDAGEGVLLGTVYAWIAVCRQALGDRAAADAALGELVRFADVAGVPDSRARRDMARGAVLILRGDWEAARDAMVEPTASLMEPGMVSSALTMAALTELMTGRAELALSRLTEALVSGQAGGMVLSPVGSATHVMSMAVRAQGDVDRAEDLSRQAQAELDNRPVPAYIRTGPISVLAGLCVRTGRVDDGVRLLAAADAERQRSGVDRDSGLTRAEIDGQGDAARLLLGDERFTELWAEGAAMGWAEAVAYAQRGRGERRRPKLGWHSLTPTELQVVELVAAGAPNNEIAERLFMAVPTVKTHLTHVYAKLGLSSRTQLAAEALRRTPSS